jgi:signal peptidase I
MPGFCGKPPELAVPGTSALFDDVLNTGVSLRVKVTGRSMTPFLLGGEILTIRKMPAQSLRMGDLIFYRDRHGFPVLHRIIEKYETGKIITFRTKGDALTAFDETVDEHEVLGKVCTIEKTVSKSKTRCTNMESPRWRKINFLIALVNLFKVRTYSLVLRWLRGTR